MEKMKKMAIFFSLNKAKAFRPNASAKDLAFSVQVGHCGKEKQYTPNNTPNTAEKYHWAKVV